LKDQSGAIISDPNGMCQVLNNYFSSVFTSENVDNIPVISPVFKGDRGEMLQDIEMKQSVIYEKLKILKQNKASGVIIWTLVF